MPEKGPPPDAAFVRDLLSEMDALRAGLPEAEAQKKLRGLLASVEARKERAGAALELLCAGLLPGDDPVCRGVVGWLDELERTRRIRGLPEPALLLPRIRLSAFAPSARPWLIKALDRKDSVVRCAAAGALGRLHARGAPGLPPLREELDGISRRELKAPGLAGPFLTEAEARPDSRPELKSWALDLFLQRQLPEPPPPPGFLALETLARRWAAGDPEAARRLLQARRTDLAVEAATAREEADEALAPLLMELAALPDPEACRRASWHLARHYRRLHPEGARQGYVAGLFHLPEVVLLMTRMSLQAGSPSAAALYPKERGGRLNDAAARRWARRIMPEGGAASFYGDEKASLWDRVIVSRRGAAPWDPRGLIEGAP